jgi:tetratricopeptide (TPR) repeat protein
VLGDLDNARLLLRRAGENAGFNADQLYEIAREQLSLGDASKAQWAITKALNGNPRHMGALAYRVRVLLALDRLEDAKVALTELQDVYPQRSETHLVAGDLLRAGGDRAAAVAEYELAYQAAPSRITVRHLFEAQV